MVDLRGPSKNERFSFTIPVANPGLRHGLRGAVEHTAENILALAHPQLAGVLFLNEGDQSSYFDEAQRYEKLAITSTFIDRGKPLRRDCLSDNVYGLSVGFRGDASEGLRILGNAAEADPSANCLVTSQTNAASLHTQRARCSADAQAAHAEFRLGREALGKLDGRWLKLSMSDADGYRVAAFRIEGDLVETEYDLLHEEGREGELCGRTPTGTQAAKAHTYDAIRELIDRVEIALPPGQEHVYFRNVVALLTDVVERVVPRSDIRNRIALSTAIVRLIDKYLDTDGTPRSLFVAKGRLLLAIAIAELDAARLPAGPTFDLARLRGGQEPPANADLKAWFSGQVDSDGQAAIVAFQNASATRTLAPLLEPSSDLEPLVRLGDAWYIFGNSIKAERAYASAVARFVDQDLPLGDMRWLTIAAARWATGLASAGACKGGIGRGLWDDTWRRLGASSDDDLCCDSDSRPECAPPRGLLHTIYPLVTESIHACAPQARAATPERIPFDDNYEMIECLGRTGPESFESWGVRLGSESTKYFDDQIRDIGEPPPSLSTQGGAAPSDRDAGAAPFRGPPDGRRFEPPPARTGAPAPASARPRAAPMSR